MADFADIFLKAPHRANLALEHHHIVAQQASFRVAFNDTIGDVTTRNHTYLGYTEGVANIGASKINFLDDWLEQSRHGALNLIRQLVDDGVQANVNLLLVGQFLSFAFRPHVEADDDGIRCRGEQHIGLGNGAPTPEQDLDLDPVVGHLGQYVAQYLDRALNVALENDIQLFLSGRLQLFRQTFKRDSRTLGKLSFACPAFAIFGDAARLLAVRHRHQLIAGLRQTFQAENLHRGCGSSSIQGDTPIVEHGANSSEDVTDHEVVAGPQSTVLHQDRCYVTATDAHLHPRWP